MSKRVCLYARVSKSSQSVERQISELEIVADRNDWEIVDRYIDHGISGSKGRDGRPELDRMMKDSTKRKFDVVLASIGGAWRDGFGGRRRTDEGKR